MSTLSLPTPATAPAAPAFVPQLGIGAVSLQRTLVRNSVNSRHTFDQIDFWLYAIKNLYNKNPETPLNREAVNIAKWYFSESKSKSYQARNWKIEPRHAALFQAFRSDEFYHLKNLVEIVMREIVEITLKAEGFAHVEVYRTSATDDVTGGVDLIARIKKEDGTKTTFGIDLAVSANQEYLAKKELRTKTKCREYNAYMGRNPEATMERQVIATDPAVMSYFLIRYVSAIGK